MKYQECLDEARTSPAPAYFLHGEEVFLHEEFIAAVKEVLLPGDDLLNYHRFEGSDEGLLEASGALGTVPFMAPGPALSGPFIWSGGTHYMYSVPGNYFVILCGIGANGISFTVESYH